MPTNAAKRTMRPEHLIVDLQVPSRCGAALIGIDRHTRPCGHETRIAIQEPTGAPYPRCADHLPLNAQRWQPPAEEGQRYPIIVSPAEQMINRYHELRRAVLVFLEADEACRRVASAYSRRQSTMEAYEQAAQKRDDVAAQLYAIAEKEA